MGQHTQERRGVMRHKKKKQQPKVTFFFSHGPGRDDGLFLSMKAGRVLVLYIHISKYPHGLKRWNLFFF